MAHCFSQKLIGDIKKYFLKEYGFELSDTAASDYLHSLTELYLVLQEIIEDKGGGEPPSGRRRAAVRRPPPLS